MKDLSLWPSFFPYCFDDTEEKSPTHFHESSGVSILEDEKNTYVEAALPGITPEEIDIHFENGMLFIKAEKKEERKDKKFYRKAHSSFFYQVTVPGEVDETKVDATCKDGILTVSFPKTCGECHKKKISVKKG